MEAMLPGMLLLWYLLTAGSLAFLVYDLIYNTPAMWVMKLAWVLIILYTGPIGLFLYLLACRQPLPGTHSEYINVHWKQAIGSMMHCVAGDATGIILAAAIVYHFGLPNGIDLIIEYSSAFVVGLLVFQALFMKSMLGGNYLLAVRKTFFAETVSMNMVMVGMIPVMVILMNRLPGSDNPTNPLFWGIMSVAAMTGMITAYPINSWMVRRGLKHGMMTASLPMPDTGPSAEPHQARQMMTETMAKHDVEPPAEQHQGMKMMPEPMAKADEAPPAEPHQMMKMDAHAAKISPATAFGVFLATLACLALAVLITSRFVDLKLS